MQVDGRNNFRDGKYNLRDGKYNVRVVEVGMYAGRW